MTDSLDVDVVVPLQGDRSVLRSVIAQLSALRLTSGGSITIVDNSRRGIGPLAALPSQMTVLRAGELQSAYFARNRGAARGSAEWLLFLDADVLPPPDLIERYELAKASPNTAILAGGARDVQAAGAGAEPLASRYCRLRRLIDQQNTLQMRRPYAKTANCAVRRIAFEHVHGFAERIRSGGDADLCFRLLGAGWQLERRPAAVVDHQSRASLRG